MLKKIAIISPYAQSIVSFRGHLIKELIKHNISVFVFSPDYTNEIKSQIRNIGAETIDYRLKRTGINPLSDVQTFFELFFRLRQIKYDAVLAYNIKPVIFGTLAAYLARIPRRIALIEGLGYVFIEDTRFSLKRKALQIIVKALYKISLKRADRVIFLNPDDTRDFTIQRIVDVEKSTCLGGIGVDLDEWRLTPPLMMPITYTLAARLLREKGILEFLEAARIIKKNYGQTRFLLLGGIEISPGAISQKEISEFVKLGIAEWYGHVVDVKPFFAQTSIYVLPSYYREGVPRSTQEAMAIGRPVITTDVPGCRETVIDGVNGFLIPPRDVKALTEAMEKFIINPEMIERMGRESRKLAEERFDVYKKNHIILRELGLI